MVDELVGGFFRLIASLLHAIFQAVLEVLFRVLIEIVFESLARIVSAIFRTVVYIIRLSLLKADGLYRALVQYLRRVVRQAALAHGLALALLIVVGFACGASASTLYHHVHPVDRAASVNNQP